MISKRRCSRETDRQLERSRYRLTWLLVAFTATTTAVAATSTDTPNIGPDGTRSCGVDLPIPGGWSESEEWAWNQICKGRTADFDFRFGTQEPSGQQTDDRFDNPRRILSAGFLRTVLTRDPYRIAVPPEGVRISGARVDGDVDLRDAVLVRVLGIFDSRLRGKLVMNRLRTSTTISFTGSTITGELLMDSAVIGGNLNMTNAEFGEVVLKTAEISGGVSMTGSRVTGRLNMNGARIGGGLYMREATFSDVDLTEATIGRQVNTSGSAFTGTLQMGSMATEGSVHMNQGSTFADIVLRSARVGGQLSMSDAVVHGELDGGSMSITEDLTLDGARFERPIELPMIRVTGALIATDASLTGLNLYGATVGQDLVFAGMDGNSVQWHTFTDEEGRIQNPIVVLWNMSVGGLLENPESWPSHLRILVQDLTYQRLFPIDGRGRGIGTFREAAWYVDWLGRNLSHSFQPYRQLAKVLRAHGEGGKANNVLIAGRERKRLRLPWWSCERWWLWALRWTIRYGYGAGELQALLCAMPFLVIGVIAARRKGKSASGNEKLGFWYSLDMLLPGIWLREGHAQVVWSGGWKHYFMFHRLVGYFLLIFVLAGLAGLAERRTPLDIMTFRREACCGPVAGSLDRRRCGCSPCSAGFPVPLRAP